MTRRLHWKFLYLKVKLGEQTLNIRFPLLAGAFVEKADSDLFCKVHPTVEAQNLTPLPSSPRKSELVSDWLKLTYA